MKSRTNLRGDVMPRNNPHPAPRLNHGLSSAQIALLRLLVDGRSRKEIQAILEISKNAVRERCINLFDTIKVKNDIQAAVWAVMHGIK
jgi:DNA-binding NarL/FixJ family response regulator